MTTVKVPVSEAITEFVATIETEEFATGRTGLNNAIRGETIGTAFRKHAVDSSRRAAGVGLAKRPTRRLGAR